MTYLPGYNLDRKKNQTNHARTHIHTRSQGYLDIISVNSGEANKHTDGERNGDTVPVNKQHPMATAMATHTLILTHTWNRFKMHVDCSVIW